MSTGTRIEVNKLMNKPVENVKRKIFSPTNIFFLTKYCNCGGSMSSLVRSVRSEPNDVQNTEYQTEDGDHLITEKKIFSSKLNELNNLQQRVSIRGRLRCEVTTPNCSEFHCSWWRCLPFDLDFDFYI